MIALSTETVTAKPLCTAGNSVVLRTRQLTNDLQDIERRVAPGASEWLDLTVAWQAVLCIDRWQLLEFDPLAGFAVGSMLTKLLDELQGTETVVDFIDPEGDEVRKRKPGKYWDGCKVHRSALQYLIAQKVRQRIALEALADPKDVPTETATPIDTKKRGRIGWIEIAGPYVAELYNKHGAAPSPLVLYRLLKKEADADDASPFRVVNKKLFLKANDARMEEKTLKNNMKRVRELAGKSSR